MDRSLTPEEAQVLVEQRIEEFGLSSLPRVRVRDDGHGGWHITWDQFQRSEAPMSAPEWCAWVERHVGTLDPERLETLEG
jgi:hypothetical protein